MMDEFEYHDYLKYNITQSNVDVMFTRAFNLAFKSPDTWFDTRYASKFFGVPETVVEDWISGKAVPANAIEVIRFLQEFLEPDYTDELICELEKNIKTNEDWYPTSEDGTVRVSFVVYKNGHSKVSLWGNDDFGIEKDFSSLAEDKARILFNSIQDFTTQDQLFSWGMYGA